MALTDCPMCHSALPTGENAPLKACNSCGADLTRWIPKPPKLPLADTIAAPIDTETPTERGLGMGTLGAIAGALVGSALMYGFYVMVGFRFPLMGVGTGLLTAFGARILYKGGGPTLGSISGGIAAVAVLGTLYLMYGEFPILNLISVIVSVSVAFRIASR